MNHPPLPQYQTALAAGLDLPSAELGVLEPGKTLVVDTGLTLDDLLTIEDRAWPIPSGCLLVGHIKGRSGLAFKHNILCFEGTLDLDYKQSIKVLLINHSKEKHDIHPGDRIAQLVFSIVYRPERLVKKVERLNGFGSTGVGELENGGA